MEEDIALLRGYNQNLDLMTVYRIYQKSLLNKKISYIPFLIDVNNLAIQAKEDGNSIIQINNILNEMGCDTLEEEFEWNKIKNLQTLELIKYADSFFHTNKMNNKHLDAFKKELSTRGDIFMVFLSFIDSIGELKSELYFWKPDLEICDISTLILSVFNIKDLIAKYKTYIKECFILGNKVQENLLKLLKERYKLPLYTHIDIMKRDMFLFPIEKRERCGTRIVSHDYWCDNCGTFEKASNAIKEEFDLPLNTDFGDFSLIFRPCLSYVEVELHDQKTLTIPVPYLDDLLNGCKIYKSFWIDNRVIDSNGNIFK